MKINRRPTARALIMTDFPSVFLNTEATLLMIFSRIRKDNVSELIVPLQFSSRLKTPHSYVMSRYQGKPVKVFQRPFADVSTQLYATTNVDERCNNVNGRATIRKLGSEAVVTERALRNPVATRGSQKDTNPIFPWD